jgi:hypothetical protein
MPKKSQVLALPELVWSYRRIERETGGRRKTVSNYVFTYTMIGMHNEDAVKRADESGAAAIFEVDMLPGNMRYQAYPSNTKAPAFTVGSDDGFAVRDLMASLPPGQSARVKATLDVRMLPNIKTALVWTSFLISARTVATHRSRRRSRTT